MKDFKATIGKTMTVEGISFMRINLRTYLSNGERYSKKELLVLINGGSVASKVITREVIVSGEVKTLESTSRVREQLLLEYKPIILTEYELDLVEEVDRLTDEIEDVKALPEMYGDDQLAYTEEMLSDTVRELEWCSCMSDEQREIINKEEGINLEDFKKLGKYSKMVDWRDCQLDARILNSCDLKDEKVYSKDELLLGELDKTLEYWKNSYLNSRKPRLTAKIKIELAKVDVIQDKLIEWVEGKYRLNGNVINEMYCKVAKESYEIYKGLLELKEFSPLEKLHFEGVINDKVKTMLQVFSRAFMKVDDFRSIMMEVK